MATHSRLVVTSPFADGKSVGTGAAWTGHSGRTAKGKVAAHLDHHPQRQEVPHTRPVHPLWLELGSKYLAPQARRTQSSWGLQEHLPV